ncbi:hypothetical protein PIB30_057906 [Stylosanthes scabra]|uniref:Uncharacterized protein n=1 Tax=Stylosanthes scabra TaxID=79078 RepID=A0ABU6YKA5_9FABA|nr:hypothetical protein [Stylosanthes scabra]
MKRRTTAPSVLSKQERRCKEPMAAALPVVVVVIAGGGSPKLTLDFWSTQTSVLALALALVFCSILFGPKITTSLFSPASSELFPRCSVLPCFLSWSSTTASRGVASLTCRPHVGSVTSYGHTIGNGYP